MELRVISNHKIYDPKKRTPQDQLKHFRNVLGSILQDSLETWGELWNELQGSMTHGYLVTEEAQKGFKPECGWPEFLEKMWQLKHSLEYAKTFCDKKE